MTTEISQDIHQIPLETPFAVGLINTYLVEGDTLTLFDCGPNTATALDDFETQLAQVGHALTDLDLIVVTHQHLDHTGLAGTLAARSGAEFVCLDLLAPILADWEGDSRASDNDAYSLMLRHGVEPHVAEALRGMASITRGYGASAPADRTLSAGDELVVGDRRFEVLYRPGHSQTDTVFFEPANRLAVLGDHLLSHVSSNALVSGRDTDTEHRTEPLLEYRASMLATRELDFDLGLGGHGAPVTDHRALIDDRIAAQDHRADHFLELLAGGAMSAHDLATAQWGGRIAITQAYLTLSEVLGHLGLLIADGRVVEDRDADVITFRRAD